MTKRYIKGKLRNTLQGTILSDMFEYPLYSKEKCTCEEIGELYLHAMRELINEYISEQELYLDYCNRPNQ